MLIGIGEVHMVRILLGIGLEFTRTLQWKVLVPILPMS
jgi:hypothetical protein